MGLGIVVIGLGAILNTENYASGILFIGFGAIIVIIGIVRLLIGFINPAIPEDLPPLTEPEEAKPDIIEAASAAYEEDGE
jgi:hypothetical protein